MISPTGEITFYPLDSQKGVANIGRHPDNDIVIDGPGVAPFHAVVDFSRRPCQILLLSPEGEPTLGGQPLQPSGSTELHPWDTLELAAHTFILLEGEEGVAAPAGAVASPLPAVPGPPPPTPGTAPAADAPPAPPPVAPVRQSVPYPDLTSDTILVDLSERNWEIDVEQTAAFQATVTNGGDIVAMFDARVEGVPESWVTISPPQFNLNEGERTVLSITITPPRHPSSRAGAYPIALVVSSPNHPGQTSQRGATLTVNPYYEFAVGELSPKEQTLSWRDATGESTVHLMNKGNSDTDFRLEGSDDERTLTFEFDIPGQDSKLARQADVRLPPEETFAIPMHLRGTSRSIVGLRNKRHHFNVSVTMLQGDQMPRALLGELRIRPLIGPPLLALITLVVGTLILLIFRPKIHEFGFRHDGTVVYPGDIVTLSWEASPFTNLVIEEEWLESGGVNTITLEPDERQRTVTPPETTRYTLIGNNLLSRILQILEVQRQLETLGDDGIVHVGVLYSGIDAFDVSPPTIVEGGSVTVFWDVVNADSIELLRNGVPIALTDGQTQYIDTPTANPTIYTLRVRSNYSDRAPDEWDDEMPREVVVLPPTPTPLPEARILQYNVTPRQLYAGSSVTITWQVEAEQVLITGGPELVESNSSTGFEVQTMDRAGDFSFRLVASNQDPTGTQEPTTAEDVIVVRVLEEPTPTPEPEPPEIASFEVVPDEVEQGESAQLTWTINGEMDRMEIAHATQDNVIFASSDASGSFPAPHVDTVGTHVYILTVYNGEETTSQTKVLTVVEPPPPPTATPIPMTIDSFVADGLRPEDEVELVNETVNSRSYSVAPGTKVELSWVITNADAPEITLSKNGEDVYSQIGANGVFQDTDAITEATQYQLHAEFEGQTADAVINILPLDLDVPPPPYDVDGQVTAADAISITWRYTAPENVYEIIGFVVWRAPDPYTDFTVAADENEITDTECSPVCQWLDETVTPCDYAYYVTAVYLDRYGDRQETEPSEERFYSGPCPTPTPH
jgi:hypothetical protein